MKKENHTVLIWEAKKCTDPDHVEGDADYACETAPKIKEFLEHKSLHILAINDKIDFSVFKETSIR